MEHRELDFKPLNFQKTLHDELRPPIFDGDNSFGDAYATGELLSLRHAKNALLIVVRFSPGAGANQVGWHSPYGEVEFLLLEQKGYYVGGINRQIPEHFCHHSTRDEHVEILGNAREKFSALGGRRSARFFCQLSQPRHHGVVPLTVVGYFRLGWFGGWKEVVVKVPKKNTLCRASMTSC